MRVTSRACALLYLAVGGVVAVVARPAAASMTIAFRDEHGVTRTIYQEGNRVRMANPTGDDPGAAGIIDLKTPEVFIVYDDVKAYFDFNKVMAKARPLIERALRKERSSRRHATVSYRPLGEDRNVNGFTCAMYQKVVAGRVEEEICFAAWGDAVGQEADFEWLGTVAARMWVAISGKKERAATARWQEHSPGLSIWSSSTAADGSRELMEVVKLSRDPVPLAMFKIPADYKEISQPLTASEHQPVAPQVVDAGRTKAEARPSGRKINGLVAIILIVGLGIGLLFHTVVLHVAASIVLDHPRLMQALVAAGIVWLMLVVVEMIGLPPVLSMSVGLLATFAGLKISYGASIPRTLALFVVSGSIMLGASFAAGVLIH